MSSGSSSAAFPRGSSVGKDSQNNGDGSKKRASTQDELFSANKRVKSIEVVKKNKGSKKPTSLVPSIGLGVTSTNERITKISYLQHEDFRSGTMFLGFVLSVTSDSALVSTPNGFTAQLSLSEVSDYVHEKIAKASANDDDDEDDVPDMSSLLKLMQPIRCCVLPKNSDKNRGLFISSRSTLINRGLALKHLNKGFGIGGCIASIEDHGWTVSCGIKDVNFFMPKRGKDHDQFVVGQPVDCVVDDINTESRIVTLVHRKNNYHELPVATKSMPFFALAPGMLFQVLVDQRLKSGFVVNYLNLFHGVIDRMSTYRILSDAEWEENPTKEKTLMARVVFVDHASKTVRLSCRPHVISYKAPSYLPSPGDIIEDCTVVMRGKKGVSLRKDPGSADSGNNDEEGKMDVDEENNDGEHKKANKKERKRREELKALEEEKVVCVTIKAKSLASVPKKRKASEAVEGESDAEKKAENSESDNEEADESKPIASNQITSAYRAGQIVPAVRVQGFKLVEGMVVGTNMKSFLESSIVHRSNIEPGQIHTVEITAIKSFGLLVQIAGKIKALCPTLHTSDTAASDRVLQKKFKVGQKLKVRVWEKNEDGIIVTNKKTLVDLPEDKILLNFDEISAKQESVGVIAGVTEHGIDVRFFNQIHGRIPMVVLTKQGVLDPLESYRVGNLIKVITLKTFKFQNYRLSGMLALALAFDLTSEKFTELAAACADEFSKYQGRQKVTPETVAAPANAESGNETDHETDGESKARATTAYDFVSGTVFRVEKDKHFVRLDSGSTAIINKHHMFDFASAAEAFTDSAAEDYPLKIGTRLENALVIGVQDRHQLITMKPLLLAATQQNSDLHIPAHLNEARQGDVVVGTVIKVESYGVLVRFRNGFTGLAPRANLTDHFIETAEGLFTVGDSVRSSVQRVDLTTSKCLLTMKSTHLAPSSGSVTFLPAFLRDSYLQAAHTVKVSGKTLPDWNTYRIGTVVKATVSAIEDYGVVLVGKDLTTMMLDRQVAGVEVGKAVKVLVLDLDFAHSIMHVRILDKVGVKAFGAGNGVVASRGEVGSAVEVEIQAVHDQYLTVSGAAFSGFVTLGDYHHLHPDTSKYTVGSRLSVFVKTWSRAAQGEPVDTLAFPHADITLFSLQTELNNAQLLLQQQATQAAEGKPKKAILEEGSVIEGTVQMDLVESIPKQPAFAVRLKNGRVARLCLTEINDVDAWEDYSDVLALCKAESFDKVKKLKKSVFHGKEVRCFVLRVNGNQIDVSLRPSRLNSTKVSQQTKADALPVQGAVIKAFVTNTSDKGCFVRIAHGTNGRILIKDLSDDFVQDPAAMFPPGTLITGRVKTVDPLKGLVQLDLKKSTVEGTAELQRAFAKLKSGSTVKGTVEQVKDIGVFVRIDGTPIVGLARAVAALQDASKTLQEEYSIGDVVRARVLKVSTATQRVALGLREKYFRADYVLEDIYKADEPTAATEEEASPEEDNEEDADEDSEEMDVDEDSEDDEESVAPEVVQKKDSRSSKKAAAVIVDDDDMGEVVEEETNKSSKKANSKRKLDEVVSTKVEKNAAAKENKKNKKQKVAEDDEIGELNWGDITSSGSNKNSKELESDDDFGENDSDEDDEDTAKDKKSKNSKKKDSDRKKQEKDLRERERALAEGRLVPESATDFERLIIAQPNSSFLWIQYIAFHVKSADIEAARVIGSRALRTIHFREEDEKFNVWVALLNMEYSYGTRDSFEHSLSLAVNESKGKLIFLSLASTMEQAKDITGAENLFEKALKRPQYRKSKKVWMAYHLLKLKHGDVTGAKAQLSRALQALSSHKHVEVIRSFAVAEFEHGSVDRGRVLFEELLSNYPKRNDIWNVYVDKEAKLGNVMQARQLFERMISLKNSPKIMKTIFKKYLFFESRHGTEQSQELVKEKARNYVNSIA